MHIYLTSPELLQAFVARRFNVQMSAERASEVIYKAQRVEAQFGDQGWLDCTWIMWLKNRLAEHPETRIPFGGGKPIEISFSTTLHVFFTSLEETPEMLLKLKNEDLITTGSVARSKLSKYLAEITPIDQTAQRVAPIPDHP